MKIALYSNTDWFMYQFNLPLALALKEAGHDVLLLTPPGNLHHRFSAIGLRWIGVPMLRRSLNPLREIRLIFWLARVLRRENVELLNNFTLKCAIYGSLAAQRMPAINIVNTINGLGYVFTSNSAKARALKPLVQALMRVAFKIPNSKTVVLNNEDLGFVSETFALERDKNVFLISGSGVDCNKFTPSHNKLARCTSPFRICLPARLLWDKGVGEYVEASHIVRLNHPDIQFHLCGAIDSGNPSAVPQALIDRWVAEGAVIWNGHVEDMASRIREFDLVVLPSHREGLPTVLTEASASGVALVATDVPGCRDVVADGVNGLLVPKGDPRALAKAIEKLYLTPALRQQFGRNAREIAVEKFSTTVIINKTFDVYFSHQGSSSKHKR